MMRTFASVTVSAFILIFFIHCPRFGHGRYVNDAGKHRENDRLFEAESLKSVLQYYKSQVHGSPPDSVEAESIEVNAENTNPLAYRIDIDSKNGVTEVSAVLSSEEDDDDSESNVSSTNSPSANDDPEEAEIETTTLFPADQMEQFVLINSNITLQRLAEKDAAKPTVKVEEQVQSDEKENEIVSDSHLISDVPSVQETAFVSEVSSLPVASPVSAVSVSDVAPEATPMSQVFSASEAPSVSETPSVPQTTTSPPKQSVPEAPLVSVAPLKSEIFTLASTTTTLVPILPETVSTAKIPAVSDTAIVLESSTLSNTHVASVDPVLDSSSVAPVLTDVNSDAPETTTSAPTECTEGQWRKQDACNLCVCIGGRFLCSKASCAPTKAGAGVKNSVKKTQGLTDIELGITNSVGTSASYSVNQLGQWNSLLGQASLDAVADEIDTLTTVPTTTTTTSTTPKPECFSGVTKSIDCNLCVCSPLGKWACTKRSCIALTLREKASYSDGSFVSKTETLLENPSMDDDCSEGELRKWGCNTCVCFHNSWSCTNEKCPTTTPAPRVADTEEACQIEHDIKTVDCNTCNCQRGIWVCTRNDCKNFGQRYELQSSRTKFRFRSSSKN